MYRNTFSKKREPSFEATVNRLDLYREVIRFRLELALEVFEDGDGSEHLVLSSFVSHYGFIILTADYFKIARSNWIPGTAGSEAELFAFTNMNEESGWLKLLNRMLEGYTKSETKERNSVQILKIIQDNELVVKNKESSLMHRGLASYGVFLLGYVALISSEPLMIPTAVLPAVTAITSGSIFYLFRLVLLYSLRTERQDRLARKGHRMTGVFRLKTVFANIDDTIELETTTEITEPKIHKPFSYLRLTLIIVVIAVYALVVVYIYRNR